MKRWLPTREQLRQSRWLRPMRRHIDNDGLWHMNRGSVARATAIGLFVGVLLPFAQFLFAIGIAIALRAHIAIAAAVTFVTNPFTFAPIYWLAYRIGSWLLGDTRGEQAADALQRSAEAVAEKRGLIEGMWHSVQSAGLPLVVGLVVLAVGSSLLGFTLVWLLWKPRHGDAPPGTRR